MKHQCKHHRWSICRRPRQCCPSSHPWWPAHRSSPPLPPQDCSSWVKELISELPPFLVPAPKSPMVKFEDDGMVDGFWEKSIGLIGMTIVAKPTISNTIHWPNKISPRSYPTLFKWCQISLKCHQCLTILCKVIWTHTQMSTRSSAIWSWSPIMSDSPTPSKIFQTSCW